MKFLHQIISATKNRFVRYFILPLLGVAMLMLGFYAYVTYEESCFRLSLYSNEELIGMLESGDNDIFQLTRNMMRCPAKQYTPYLIKALDSYQSGRIFNMHAGPIGTDANEVLNHLYKKDFYHDGRTLYDGKFMTDEEAMRKTGETIRAWNTLYNKGELK